MKNFIVGTAGHVDHGKTKLIKALTGIETDRLKEEKNRGITIENGFAYLKNEDNLNIGIIDVPGHEKFIKNMLAGIGGIDLVLLIISIEEGIKKQTIEHFEILKSLKIKKGIIVLTKYDIFENDKSFNLSNYKIDGHNELFIDEIKSFIKDSFLENSEMIEVSSYTNYNIDKLKNLIINEAINYETKNIIKDFVRLPIDRVFTMDGFGTVITGTLIDGRIDINDELVIYPSNKKIKVRKIESYDKDTSFAELGQRVALNLSNISKNEIKRGDVIAKENQILLSTYIETKIDFFSFTSKIKNNQNILFYYGSAEIEAKIKLINENYAIFHFQTPIPIKRNDKFIIRNCNPKITCGGGTVINVETKKIKIENGEFIKHLNIFSSNDEKLVLLQSIQEKNKYFYNKNYYKIKLNLYNDIFDSLVLELINDKKIICIEDMLITSAYYEEIVSFIKENLKKFHNENPLLKGIKKEDFYNLLKYKIENEKILNYDIILNYFIEKDIVKKEENFISLKDFIVYIDDKKMKLYEEVENTYKKYQFEVPTINELFSNNKNYKDISIIIKELVKNGTLIKLSNEYIIHKESFSKAVNYIYDFFKNNDKMLMKDLRDGLKTSRKYAILIIDYCDSVKITKLIDGYRVLYKK